MISNSTRYLLMFFLFLIACSSPSLAKQRTGKPTTAKPSTAKAPLPATHTVVIYYLYTEPRCASCMNIEKYTKESIEKAFSKELKSGRLVWMPVDVKKDGNWHYVEDFRLRSKTVVVADYRGFKEDKTKILAWKNLEEVWPLLKDKEKFTKYIEAETRGFLDQKYEKPNKDEKKDKNKNGGGKKP